MSRTPDPRDPYGRTIRLLAYAFVVCTVLLIASYGTPIYHAVLLTFAMDQDHAQ